MSSALIASSCRKSSQARHTLLTVRRTHCHHYFHAACLIRYWDEDGQFEFRCPLCRTSGGRVRDRVEFVAGREDFAPNTSEETAHAWTVEDADNMLRLNPGMDVADMPSSTWYALGRRMESRLLQRAIAHSERRGFPLIP